MTLEAINSNNAIKLYNVSGQNIIFRNFRGRSTPFTREGDRSFCLIVAGLIRDQLAARGCNLKKLTNGTEFVNVVVRISPAPEENADHIWTTLDVDHIDQADLEFMFYEYNINGKRVMKIYLKDANFHIKNFNNEYVAIGIHYPNHVTCTVDNKNNTEDTAMEKIMSVEEILTQFALMEYAYKTAKPADQKNIHDLMQAIKSAKYYIVSKAGDCCETAEDPDTKSTHEAIGDFAAIKQVIFNDPATIVVWWDDTKTVVKCQKGDTFDKEKGLAMAICKRLYGNESNYNNVINKWAHPKKPKETVEPSAKKEDKLPKDLPMVRQLRADELLITDSWRECVRKRLAQNGWSQKDLFRRSGVSAQTISRIVGKYGPSPLKVVVFDKINKTLNIRWKVEEDAVPSSKKKEKSSNLVPLTDELINSVREKMKKRNISLSDLSRMSGVSLSAIGRYFSGNSPRPKAMRKRKYDAIMKVIDSSES